MFDIETEPSDLDLDGKRVDVYRNLQDDCLSIRSAERSAGSTAGDRRSTGSRDTDSDDYGTVIGHADLVLLSDAEFVVQEAGQERARETGVKNVHAVVRGTVEGVDADGEIEWNLMVRMFGNDLCNVHYDPFETDAFEVIDPVRMDTHDFEAGDAIDEALYASVTREGVGAMLPDDE